MRAVKTVSSQIVLQKASSRLGANSSGWHGDAIEWIGEAIKGIGYHTGFQRLDLKLEVKDYYVKIPFNVESIEGIYFKGIPLGVGYDEEGRYIDKKKYPQITYEDLLILNKRYKRYEELNAEMESLEPSTDPEVMDALVDSINKLKQSLYNIGIGAQYLDDCYYPFYNIKNGYIKTSFPCGIIEIKANGIMLDCDGYPEVVDTFKYQEALTWYIIYNALLSGRVEKANIDWREAFRMWTDYRYEASNEGKMFTRDEMARFSLMWNSLKRDSTLTFEN